MDVQQSKDQVGFGHLVSDIGRCGAGQSSPETPEQQLLRLAKDPLAVGAFIQARERHDPGLEVAAKIPAVLSFCAMRGADVTFGQRIEGGEAGRERYDRGQDRGQDSIFPAPFTPSADDRCKAVEILVEGTGYGVQSSLGQRTVLLVAAASICAAVVWLMVKAVGG